MRMAEPLADRSRWSSIGHCPIEKAMTVVGSKPAMLIMREAHYGTRRFDDFVTRVGLAPATASSHLRALTEAGLVERRPYREAGARTREEYLLTAAGADLMTVVMGLFEWGVKHADGTDELGYVHAGCGEPVHVRATCAAGHEVATDEVEVRLTR